jgi:hypothetical protein
MVCETKIDFEEKRRPDCRMTSYNIQVNLSDEDMELLYGTKFDMDGLTDSEKLVALGSVLGTIKSCKNIALKIRGS